MSEILSIKNNLKVKFEKIQSGENSKIKKSTQRRSRSRKPNEKRSNSKKDQESEKNGQLSLFSKPYNE